MFFIPGQLIGLLTFPGVIVHELAHQICCRICNIPVFEVKYFQFSNPCGYVIHEKCDNPWKNLLTAAGPFLVNTVLGMIITMPAYLQLFVFGDIESTVSSPLGLLQIFLLWVGFSVLMHAFPSTGDARSLVASVLKNQDVSLIAKIITAPIVGLIYLGALGSVVWLDLAYAVAISMLGPSLLVKIFYG